MSAGAGVICLPLGGVTIIIVSYRSQEDIIACLGSLGEARTQAQVIVVDNASRDGTSDAIRRSFPEVSLLSMPKNMGFAVACNRGIRASTSRYCLFLNPDVRLSLDALVDLIRFAEKNPQVGIVGPRVLNQDGRTVQISYRSFPTIGTLFFHQHSLLNRVFPNNPWRRKYLLIGQDLSEPRPVDWVSGCCMLARREVLDGLDGFDERFFMYSEDVDLCLRAKQAGWQTCYDPRACVTHLIGGSSGGLRPLIERHRSVWRYYKKHMANGQGAVDAFVFLAVVVRCFALLLAKVISGISGKFLRSLYPSREGVGNSG